MHDEVGFPHYLVDKKKFKKRFKKYDHVSTIEKIRLILNSGINAKLKIANSSNPWDGQRPAEPVRNLFSSE